MRWRPALAALIALCALTPAGWPQTGLYLWRAATGGQIRSRPVAGPDGTTYALSEDSYLYAWVSGGSLLWKHDLGSMPWDCLAASVDGTIYAGLRNGDLVAVNPRGGRLWTVRLDGVPAGDPAIAEDGTVLVGTSAGTLTALSHLGRREWEVTLPGAVTGQPAIDGAGTIYVVAADRRLYALAPWGEFKWSLPFTAAPGAPAIADDGSVVLGTDAGEIVAVSSTGDERWRKSVGSPVMGVAAGAQQLVADSRSGRVAGFSLDGRELWRTDTGRSLGSPPFIDGDRVFLFSQDGSLVVLDPSGAVSQIAKTAAVGGVTASENGEVLVGGRDWVVYSLNRATTGLPVPHTETTTYAETAANAGTGAPWPQPGHDGKHSGRTHAPPALDNGALLAANPDYLYLTALTSAPGRDGIQLLLSDIERRISSRTLDKSRWYVVRILENVVGTGVTTRALQNHRLVNDFPDLRAVAAGLLTRIGSTASRSALLGAVNAETDGVALAAEIGALGAIASDGDGDALRAIVRAFTRRAGLPPDNRLASAIVGSIGRIGFYGGTIAEPGAVAILLAISRGSYDPAVRSAANAILRGELKMDILNQEE